MIVFGLLTVVLLITALGVVLAHNPIHSALSLITNMLAIGALFAYLDAHFLATVQIIVYAGAVMVLVVFVLMLLNLKIEEPKKSNKFFLASCVIAAGLVAIFGVPVMLSGFSEFKELHPNFNGSMEALGKILYTNYIFPFEAASFLIMAAVAGAVMLAKRKGKA
jgi:NADH-quinone oxidoreductase subunit J